LQDSREEARGNWELAGKSEKRNQKSEGAGQRRRQEETGRRFGRRRDDLCQLLFRSATIVGLGRLGPGPVKRAASYITRCVHWIIRSVAWRCASAFAQELRRDKQRRWRRSAPSLPT